MTAIKRRFRPTIMDGRVVEFAMAFRDSEGILGMHSEALGPFEISASRNAVIIHRAALPSDESYAAFTQALADARKAHAYIAQHDDVPQDVRDEQTAAQKAFAVANADSTREREAGQENL